MKKILISILAITLLVSTIPAFCAQGRKGASDRALERASDEAIFHRVADWFATRGKSPEEKEEIIAERKAERAAARAKKEAEKKKKQLEKEAKKRQKKLKGKTKGSRK
jgi:cyclophilin family peptidyl-prolyl cis-trans isomerase